MRLRTSVFGNAGTIGAVGVNSRFIFWQSLGYFIGYFRGRGGPVWKNWPSLRRHRIAQARKQVLSPLYVLVLQQRVCVREPFEFQPAFDNYVVRPGMSDGFRGQLELRRNESIVEQRHAMKD